MTPTPKEVPYPFATDETLHLVLSVVIAHQTGSIVGHEAARLLGVEPREWPNVRQQILESIGEFAQEWIAECRRAAR